MKPDLSKVTAVASDHRNPRAMVKMLAAHADALDLGDIKYLNFSEGYAQAIYWNNYEIWKYVRTPFALFLSADGYVVNPQLWDSVFLRYDYVGAPWPAWWTDNGTGRARVGNDGFCLKSRRLLCRVAELPWQNVPSDILVCCRYRELLESEGFKFAPAEVAARFSVEHAVDETPDLNRTFGFHGCKRYPDWDENRSAI